MTAASCLPKYLSDNANIDVRFTISKTIHGIPQFNPVPTDSLSFGKTLKSYSD